MPVTTNYFFNQSGESSLSGPAGSATSASAGRQSGATVVATANGDSVVFYYDEAASEVVARTVSSANVVGARIVVSTTSVFVDNNAGGFTDTISAARLTNGNIVVTWTSNEAIKTVYYRVYDASLNPITNATVVPSGGVVQLHPDVAALTGGGFVIAFERVFSATDTDPLAFRYTAAGVQVGGLIGIDGSLSRDQRPSVAGLVDGGFAVAYVRFDTAAFTTSLYSGVYNADGTTRTAAALVDIVGSINRDVDVVARADGGYTLFYEDSSPASSSALNSPTNTAPVFYRFSATGTPGVPTNVYGGTGSGGLDPGGNDGAVAAATSASGFTVVTFTSRFSNTDSDIIATLIDPAGNPASVSQGFITGSFALEEASSVTWLDNGRFRVTYQTPNSVGTDADYGIATVVVEVIRQTTGDAANNVLNFANDTMRNEISGGDGNDTLTGGNLNDSLLGGNNTDTLSGGLGADFLDGGNGTDTASYAADIGGVFVNLASGLGFGNAAAGDVLVSIENLIGTAYDDTFVGDSGTNVLDGGLGNDNLIGGLGADVLIGGAGTSDTAGYDDNQGAVFVNLASGQGFGNAAQGDTYSGIENLTGSVFGDYFIGDSGANRLDGSGGNDTLIGGLGADVLIGGAGNDTASYEDNQGAVFVNLATGNGFGNAAQGDTYSGIENLTGSVFYDYFIGDAQDNIFDGGRGNDTFTGGAGADTFAFTTALNGVINVDTITDFTSGTDRIQLSSAIFAAAGPIGILNAAAFISGAAATNAAQRIIYNAATGDIFYDADGNGAGAAVLFAHVNPGTTVTAGDFIIA
jgi:hypothetical protein